MLKHCCSEKGREDSSTMPANTKMLFGRRKKNCCQMRERDGKAGVTGWTFYRKDQDSSVKNSSFFLLDWFPKFSFPPSGISEKVWKNTTQLSYTQQLARKICSDMTEEKRKTRSTRRMWPPQSDRSDCTKCKCM